MELLMVGVLAIALLLIAPVLAIIALVRGEQTRRRLLDLTDLIGTLEARMIAVQQRLTRASAVPAAPESVPPPGEAVAAEPAPPMAAVPSAPVPAPTGEPSPPALPSLATAPPRPAPLPAARPPLPVPRSSMRPPPPAPPRPPKTAGTDFATNLGPRLLIGGGAVAVIVALGFFVKLAWDSNWVGPGGRVLLGMVASVAMAVTGLQILSGRYRPLGQGLAAAGFAGAYVSVFGAHGFYDLIPRSAAGVFMVVVTTLAVLLAERRDARLLAGLAWVGGYLTPVLLSTGEDKALALFLFVALLDAGALVLDHRRPWPETVPIAATGTVLLYGGWFARFFSPARFGVAAFGVVLFTALFALGMARKRRGPAVAAVLVLATVAVTAMAVGADQPSGLLLLSLLMAGTALAFARDLGLFASLVALVASGLPLAAWGVVHYRAEAFGIAAAWVTGALVMFLLFVRGRTAVPAGSEDQETSEAASGWTIAVPLAAAGMASAAMATRTDQPLGLLAFLLAQAGIAILARGRSAWSEVIGVLGAGVTISAWLAAFFKPGREGDAFLIALPVAGAYLLTLVARGLVRRRDLGIEDVFAHLTTATLVWMTLFHVLYDTAAKQLGLVSLALAAVYLGLGLAAQREKPQDRLQVRTWLGLAAVFLTLAIPVQLGLHGITLAWAVEGVLLLALGLRFGSLLTRVGALSVLVLAVLRLFARHYPLRHGEAFTPVLNPAFGIWLAVVLALAVAALLLRRAESPEALDATAAAALAVIALVLLFGVLTGETAQAFDQTARLAREQGDLAGVEQARLRGRLAISVLWTVFATGLLAGGVGLRNRPLLYAAYGLFAVTAAKVVLSDLATLQGVYRILSALALGLLLMAGAYLILRFRERLVTGEVPQ